MTAPVSMQARCYGRAAGALAPPSGYLRLKSLGGVQGLSRVRSLALEDFFLHVEAETFCITFWHLK
jgi:hypothetical protein